MTTQEQQTMGRVRKMLDDGHDVSTVLLTVQKAQRKTRSAETKAALVRAEAALRQMSR